MKKNLDTELTLVEKSELLDLLEEFSDVFDVNRTSMKSRCNAVKQKINTGDSSPIKQR